MNEIGTYPGIPSAGAIRLDDPVDHPVFLNFWPAESSIAYHAGVLPARMVGGEVRDAISLRNVHGEIVTIPLRARPPQEQEKFAPWMRASLQAGPLAVLGLGPVTVCMGLAPFDAIRPLLFGLLNGILRAGTALWLFVSEDWSAEERVIKYLPPGKTQLSHEEATRMLDGIRLGNACLSQLIRSAHGVIVWTNRQAELIRAYDPLGPVVVIPPCLDLADIPEPTRDGQKTQIGFGGAPKKYINDFWLADGALRTLAVREDVRISFWGGGPGVYQRLQLPGHNRVCKAVRPPGRFRYGEGTATSHQFVWDYLDYLRAISHLDVAVAPLAATTYNESRWQGHWMEHGIFGTPIVASDLSPYDALRDGETILKARTEADWHLALTRLVDDPDLRHRIGNAARAEVLANYTTESVGPRWRDWYAEARGATDRADTPRTFAS